MDRAREESQEAYQTGRDVQGENAEMARVDRNRERGKG